MCKVNRWLGHEDMTSTVYITWRFKKVDKLFWYWTADKWTSWMRRRVTPQIHTTSHTLFEIHFNIILPPISESLPLGFSNKYFIWISHFPCSVHLCHLLMLTTLSKENQIYSFSACNFSFLLSFPLSYGHQRTMALKFSKRIACIAASNFSVLNKSPPSVLPAFSHMLDVRLTLSSINVLREGSPPTHFPASETVTTNGLAMQIRAQCW